MNEYDNNNQQNQNPDDTYDPGNPYVPPHGVEGQQGSGYHEQQPYNNPQNDSYNHTYQNQGYYNNQNQQYSNNPQYDNNQGQPYQNQQYYNQAYQNQPQNSRSTLALISLIVGIASLFTICLNTWIGLGAAIISIVLCFQSKKDTGKLSGMAIGGLVLSIITLVLFIIVIFLAFMYGFAQGISGYL